MTGFQDPIAGAGGNLLIPAVQSPDFSIPAMTGWAIMKNGDAYFYNITAAGSVTTNTVIVKGTGDGVFVYDGAPGLGTLVVAIASAAGTDAYGNTYSGPGVAVSAPGGGSSGKNEIQIRPDKNAILIYAP
jgi:hypothetical protein